MSPVHMRTLFLKRGLDLSTQARCDRLGLLRRIPCPSYVGRCESVSDPKTPMIHAVRNALSTASIRHSISDSPIGVDTAPVQL